MKTKWRNKYLSGKKFFVKRKEITDGVIVYFCLYHWGKKCYASIKYALKGTSRGIETSVVLTKKDLQEIRDWADAQLSGKIKDDETTSST